jgi:hypothetical protein
MIPPRFIPPGILQLYEVEVSGEKKLLIELPTTAYNRERVQRMRNDLLMTDSTLRLVIAENNSFK